MDKKALQSLGKQLAETVQSLSSFDSLCLDIKHAIAENEAITLTVMRAKDKNGGYMADSYSYKVEQQTKLNEEAIPIKMASDVWKDHTKDAKNYISNQVYFVKPEGDKFVVTIEQNNKRKTFATLSKVELDKSFVEVRSNQTPDAEGYIQYRDVDQLEAFKYNDDTIKVELDNGDQLLLNLGDYLTRKANENDFDYEVMKSKDFETHYEQKK